MPDDEPELADMHGALRDNIAALAERRRREQGEAPLSERLSDRITCFVGSMRFVMLHLALYAGWIAVNLLDLGVPHFDPSFVILASEASVEAIFLSTFVLISQNRMAAAADRRADLDLHINLLAEHELTRLASVVEQIAKRLGVDVEEPEFREIEKDVRPQMVLDALDKEDPRSDA